MNKKIIEKKIWPEFFEKVRDGEKTFELRKDEDDIQTGDILVLREYRKGNYTGRSISREVTYVLRDAENFGLIEGYCIIAMQPVGLRFCRDLIKKIEPTCCKDCSKFDDCRISQGAEFWCKYAEENG